MFKQGVHQTKVRVGFYTQILGLGETPMYTTIKNLAVPNGSKSRNLGGLCNFWRAAENLKVDDDMTWAVS